MSVHSWRELPRVVTHLIGSSPEFERRFVATLNDPDTNAGAVISTIGVNHYTAHPEFAAAKCYDVSVNESYEGNRYWHEVVARYRIPPAEEKDADLLPWLRPDVWKFVTQGVAVPALYYYDDNDVRRPMTNSATDYIEGVTADEAQQKITITSNRQEFPSALAAAVTNCINDSGYLGFARDCVKVQGISGEQTVEQVNAQEVRYWKITSELLARETGWSLLIPDVGFNYLEEEFPDGKKRKRATVSGPDGIIPSASPVALDGEGGQMLVGELPAILTRRVYKRITMSTYFGTPPS